MSLLLDLLSEQVTLLPSDNTNNVSIARFALRAGHTTSPDNTNNFSLSRLALRGRRHAGQTWRSEETGGVQQHDG